MRTGQVHTQNAIERSNGSEFNVHNLKVWLLNKLLSILNFEENLKFSRTSKVKKFPESLA